MAIATVMISVTTAAAAAAVTAVAGNLVAWVVALIPLLALWLGSPCWPGASYSLLMALIPLVAWWLIFPCWLGRSYSLAGLVPLIQLLALISLLDAWWLLFHCIVRRKQCHENTKRHQNIHPKTQKSINMNKNDAQATKTSP